MFGYHCPLKKRTVKNTVEAENPSLVTTEGKQRRRDGREPPARLVSLPPLPLVSQGGTPAGFHGDQACPSSSLTTADRVRGRLHSGGKQHPTRKHNFSPARFEIVSKAADQLLAEQEVAPPGRIHRDENKIALVAFTAPSVWRCGENGAEYGCCELGPIARLQMGAWSRANRCCARGHAAKPGDDMAGHVIDHVADCTGRCHIPFLSYARVRRARGGVQGGASAAGSRDRLPPCYPHVSQGSQQRLNRALTVR